MNFFNNLMKYTADVFDIAFTKIAVFAGALFIAKVWDTVLGLDWYWYLLIFIIASIKPMVNFFKVMKQSENQQMRKLQGVNIQVRLNLAVLTDFR